MAPETNPEAKLRQEGPSKDLQLYFCKDGPGKQRSVPDASAGQCSGGLHNTIPTETLSQFSIRGCGGAGHLLSS